MNAVDGFGLDTITLAGPLEAKLDAIAGAGFTQVMLNARDLVGHPGGVDAAVAAVRASGLRTTGFQVLRDFEGLSGHLHEYKLDIAKAMLEMCAAAGGDVLLACSSTSQHATDDLDALAADLKKLAMLALPLGIRIAYEGLSWGRTVNEYTTAWDVVDRADWPNLGVAIDSFHVIAAKTPLDDVELIDPERIFLVQLSDFMWQDAASFADRIATARTFRVFPARACTATPCAISCAASTGSATAATTASRSSTTTTSSCLWTSCAGAAARARSGSRARCCAGRRRCRGGWASGPDPARDRGALLLWRRPRLPRRPTLGPPRT